MINQKQGKIMFKPEQTQNPGLKKRSSLKKLCSSKNLSFPVKNDKNRMRRSIILE